jgi:hypothetical protein
MSDVLHEIMLIRVLSGGFSMLNYDAFRASTPVADPYPYAVTPNLMSPEAVAAAIRDYPKIDMGRLVPA